MSVRFRTPDEGVSRFDDLVRGEVAVDWSTISDFVIVRSDSTPVFYLANAVDDLDMGITHVIRGEDLLDTTHRILALRAALGSDDRPQFAHLPLILGDGGAKLSKRHGAVAIEDFRDEGYLAEALANYLALLGWAPEDGREVLSLDELVAEFDLGRVTHSAARFDYQKLDWVNGEWIRRLALDELVARVEPFVRDRFGEVDATTLRGATAVGQPRAVTLVALVEQMDFLFEPDDEFAIAPDAWEKVEATERAAELFDAVIAYVADCEWNHDEINVLDTVKALDLKPRKAMPALYAAIEGRARRAPALRLDRAARTRAEPRPAPGGTPAANMNCPFGGGVIGNTTGSGPVFGGSSPPPRASLSAVRPARRLRLPAHSRPRRLAAQDAALSRR